MLESSAKEVSTATTRTASEMAEIVLANEEHRVQFQLGAAAPEGPRGEQAAVQGTWAAAQSDATKPTSEY